MRSLKVVGLLLLCGGLAACSSSATTAPAAGGGGGGVATTAPAASGGGVASSFHAWCVDYSANQTVIPALFALENGMQRVPPGSPITVNNQPLAAADMGTAANDAATLAAESVAVVHFPGTAMPDLELGADMNGVAQTLKTAAGKMANGDTSGYGEVGPGAFNAAGSTNGLLATLAVVTSACTTFAGVAPNQQPPPTTATAAPATAAPATASATGTPAASSAAQRSGVATSISACDLVTASEASKLGGASLGKGTEGTGPSGGETCTYGIPQPWNILGALVAQAPDAAAAQAAWAQDGAWAQSFLLGSGPGGVPAVTLKPSDVTVAGADKAVLSSATGQWARGPISASVLYAVKGPFFVAISDYSAGQGAPGPSLGALETQMATTLGRLP